jgi:hypothetical protein
MQNACTQTWMSRLSRARPRWNTARKFALRICIARQGCPRRLSHHWRRLRHCALLSCSACAIAAGCILIKAYTWKDIPDLFDLPAVHDMAVDGSHLKQVVSIILTNPVQAQQNITLLLAVCG